MKHNLVRACALIIISSLCGCSLIPQALRKAEKPAKEALDLKAESKLATRIEVIPARFRCPKCGHETDAEGAVLVTKKDIEKRFTLGAEREGPKFSWWQKILRWFWGMGLIGVVLVIILFLFVPGFLGALLGRIRPARALKRVARGLENARAKDNAAVASQLSEEMTVGDKKRIRKWRNKGKI